MIYLPCEGTDFFSSNTDKVLNKMQQPLKTPYCWDSREYSAPCITRSSPYCRLLEEEISHDLTICTKVDHWIYLLANNSLNNGESSPLQGTILDHSHPKPMNLLNWIFHITAHHWYINNRTTAFSTWQDILEDQLALSSWKRDVQLNFSLYQPTLPFHPTLSDFSPELITEIYTLFSKKTIEKVSEQNQHSGFYAR